MTRSLCVEAAEAPVTLRTTTSNDNGIEKVLTTREIEDVVYQTVYACQNNVLQVSKKIMATINFNQWDHEWDLTRFLPRNLKRHLVILT